MSFPSHIASDPLWADGLILVHIAAGVTGLIFAPLALATRKGSRAHRRWGKIYFWAMMAVALTALPIALFRPALFLAFIAVLSFYLAFSGYRVLYLKGLARGGHAQTGDWLAALVALGACGTLAGLGLLHPALVSNLGVVALVLGGIGVQSALQDLRRFLRPPASGSFWVQVHLSRFIGSYIAGLTAFAVNVVPRFAPEAGLYAWLAPTVLGSVTIAIASAYYGRRFARAG